MFGLTRKPAETVWEVLLTPATQNELAGRTRLLEQVRPMLEKQLRTTPHAEEFRWQIPFYTIHVRRKHGDYSPGTEIKLVCDPLSPESVRSQPSRGSGTNNGLASSLPSLCLPNPEAERIGQRLVGLEAIQEHRYLHKSPRGLLPRI